MKIHGKMCAVLLHFNKKTNFGKTSKKFFKVHESTIRFDRSKIKALKKKKKISQKHNGKIKNVLFVELETLCKIGVTSAVTNKAFDFHAVKS